MRVGWGLAALAAVLAVGACANEPTPVPMTIQEYAAFRCGEGSPVSVPVEDLFTSAGVLRQHIESLERVEPPGVLRDLHEASLDFARALVAQHDADPDATTNGLGMIVLLPEASQALDRLTEAEREAASKPEVREAWHEGCSPEQQQKILDGPRGRNRQP